MIEIVQNYRQLKSRMAALIDRSGYKNSFIAEKIGMTPSLFSVKKHRGNWTEDEIEKIVALIEDDELDDFLLGKIMEEIEKSGKAEYISSEEFKKEMGWI